MGKNLKRRITKKSASLGLIGGLALAVVPVLIGGKVVNPEDYPAIVRIRSNDGAGCTAAVTGPNSLLTAAHCVDKGGWVSFTKGGYTYTSEPCAHHPGYAKNQTKDFALCKVKDVPGPWITVNIDHDFVKIGDTLLLTGYGCIKEGGGGGNDGKLRIGETEVIRTPKTNSFDIITRSKAALCFGDSGGPVFKGAKQVGVNSRGNIKDTSYLSATHLADQDFMLPWAEKNKAEICGVNRTCQKEEEKQPEPEPIDPDRELNWWESAIWWMLDLVWGWVV